MRLFKRRTEPDEAPGVVQAREALEASRRRGKEVDALVSELRDRRIQNRFAPSLEAALSVNRRGK